MVTYVRERPSRRASVVLAWVAGVLGVSVGVLGSGWCERLVHGGGGGLWEERAERTGWAGGIEGQREIYHARGGHKPSKRHKHGREAEHLLES